MYGCAEAFPELRIADHGEGSVVSIRSGVVMNGRIYIVTRDKPRQTSEVTSFDVYRACDSDTVVDGLWWKILFKFWDVGETWIRCSTQSEMCSDGRVFCQTAKCEPCDGRAEVGVYIVDSKDPASSNSGRGTNRNTGRPL